jgi:methionyl-tRNA formyltransferase
MTPSARRPARSPEPGAAADGVRAVFFGSGSFAVPILRGALRAPGIRLVAVVTVPPAPSGRHAASTATPVGDEATRLGLPLLVPATLRDDAVATTLAALDARLGVAADYGLIVPQHVIDLFGAGILNTHPSLLPRWRGATPIAATIAAGDRETGVTIISMDAGIDSGPVVAADRWALGGDEDAPGLLATAAARGADLLARTAGPWARGELATHAQDEASATMTRPLRRADGWLDPREPAVGLERRVRAYRPWPGTFVETPTGRLIVHRVGLSDGHPADRPGVLVEHGDGVALATVAGRLVLDEVQPAGGKRMSGAEYRQGRGRALVGLEVRARTMDGDA